MGKRRDVVMFVLLLVRFLGRAGGGARKRGREETVSGRPVRRDGGCPARKWKAEACKAGDGGGQRG